jgi:release factor glutamine methyltransferase
LNIREAISVGAERLKGAGIPEPRLDASLLLAYLLGCDRSFLIMNPEDQVEPEPFFNLISRRIAGEPLQYILGRQEFYGLEFEVSRDVLIPRPETEFLVEAAIDAIKDFPSPLICDVGTGSGCIIISILKTIPAASGIAVDLSEPALAVARRNSSRHMVESRLNFVAADCFSAFGMERVSFDVVVSNPPYVSDLEFPSLQREVRDYEPRLALTAGEDGLNIVKRLLSESQRFLRKGGFLILEIGYGQLDRVLEYVDSEFWEIVRLYNDYQGIPRIVALRAKSFR